MTRRLSLLLPLFAAGFLACGEDTFPLEADLENLEWEWVDFHTDACMDCLCESGCAPTRLTLTQTDKNPVTIDMPSGHDTDHICIDGYPVGTDFQPMEMQPSERLILDISVCGYLPGELNLEDQEPPIPIKGNLVFSANENEGRLMIPWSFIPYRIQGGMDTGR
ncbi:MAG: hypothetical protein VX519_12720 [Myxococcota bacterium]|nr:hypothetical protein [Myxococcota bacterium]